MADSTIHYHHILISQSLQYTTSPSPHNSKTPTNTRYTLYSVSTINFRGVAAFSFPLFPQKDSTVRTQRGCPSLLVLPDWARFPAQFGNPGSSTLQPGLPGLGENRAESGNTSPCAPSGSTLRLLSHWPAAHRPFDTVSTDHHDTYLIWPASFCFLLTPDFCISYLFTPLSPGLPVGSPEGVLLQREFHLLCVGTEE